MIWRMVSVYQHAVPAVTDKGKIKMKRSIILALVLALCAAVTITSTLAYLTSTDSDTNVMTVGKVSIEQNEYQRDENNDMEEFEQGKPMVPSVYDELKPEDEPGKQIMVGGQPMETLDDTVKNVVDKVVTVENTGNTSAYARTLFAFEQTDGDIWSKVGTVFDKTAGAPVVYPNVVEINGKQWVIVSYTYNDALTGGKESLASLTQVYFDKTVSNQDLKDIGEQYEILVLSQAVQADGFADAVTALDAGFGAITDANVVAWFGNMVESGALAETVAQGGNVTIGDATVDSAVLNVTKPANINLTGVLTASNDGASAKNSSALTVQSVVTIDGSGAVVNEDGYAITVGQLTDVAPVELTIKGGNYKGVVSAVNVVKGTLKIEGGYFVVEDSAYGSTYLINCIDANLKNGTAKVEITGGTFVNWDPSNSKAENPAANFVPAGYHVETSVDGTNTIYTVKAN